MPIVRVDRLAVAVLLVAAASAFASRAALAQRHADRILTRLRTKPVVVRQGAGQHALIAPAFDTLAVDTLTADVLANPFASLDGGDRSLGVVAGVDNLNRFSTVPWHLLGRGASVTESGATHTQWQADAGTAPAIGWTLMGMPLFDALAAEAKYIRNGTSAQQASAEFDISPTPADSAVQFGVVGYYEWDRDALGVRTHGSTVGVTSSWTVSSALTIAGEYDFANHFAGDVDDYTVAASYVLLDKPFNLSLGTAWSKGNVLSIEIDLGVPWLKTRPHHPAR